MKQRKNFIPQPLLNLMERLKKLPGVGSRTAERFAFEMLFWSPFELKDLGEELKTLKEKTPFCPVCGCLYEPEKECSFCSPERDKTLLCLIASPRDAYSIEETGGYWGQYHILEHLLSPLEGRHASGLNVEKIEKRIQENGVKELVIALDSTLEGDATALYLKQRFASFPIVLTRLAFGMPVGSSFDYIDASTLTRAFTGRQKF